MSTRFFELLNCTYVRTYVCRNEGQQAGKRPVHSIFSIKGSSFSFFSWNVDTISLATKNFNRMEGKFFPLKGKILTDFEKKKKVTKILFHSQSSRYYSTAWWVVFSIIFPEQYWRRSTASPVEERGDEKCNDYYEPRRKLISSPRFYRIAAALPPRFHNPVGKISQPCMEGARLEWRHSRLRLPAHLRQIRRVNVGDAWNGARDERSTTESRGW